MHFTMENYNNKNEGHKKRHIARILKAGIVTRKEAHLKRNEKTVQQRRLLNMHKSEMNEKSLLYISRFFKL